MPRVASAVAYVHHRTVKVEVVAVRIACVDAEVPQTVAEVERTIEVAGGAVCAILPVEEHVAEVHVTIAPVRSVEVVVCVYADEVVEVYLVSRLILVVCEIEFIRHLVCEEQCLLACLLIAHCVYGDCHCEQ